MSTPFAGRVDGEEAARRARVRAGRVRRGMFLLPSLFTAGSIGAGYFAITQTIDSIATSSGGAQHLDRAAIAILFAIPFDALDGRIARMTNTTSDFGKELDSLADAITFGVAPCLLAWVWVSHSLPAEMNDQLRQTLLQIGLFVCFLYLLCGVSRLARFNISHDPQPRNPGRLDRKYFVGMPIPAAAGMVASTVHFCYGFPIPYWGLALLWIGLVGLLGFLMVSTWRFWSGKEINFSNRQPFQLLVVLAIVLFVLIRFSSGALFFVALAYMFSGIWARAAYSWSRRRRHMPRVETAGRDMEWGMSRDKGQDTERDTNQRARAAFTVEYPPSEQETATQQQEFTPLHSNDPDNEEHANEERYREGYADSMLDPRQDARPDGY